MVELLTSLDSSQPHLFCQLKTLAFILCFHAFIFILSTTQIVGMQTDELETHSASHPSHCLSVAMEAFILLFHKGLLPYFLMILASVDLVSSIVPKCQRIECMTYISIMCIPSNRQLWLSLPTKDTGIIWLIGNHTHSRPIRGIIVHAIVNIRLSFALSYFDYC